MIYDPKFITEEELSELESLLNENKGKLNTNIVVSEQIIDIDVMIKSHLSILRNNNHNVVFIPYLNRLKKLLK